MADPSEQDPNPPIITYTKGNGTLEEKTTHRDPVEHKKEWIIAHEQAEIDKYDSVIAQWELKKKPHQDIIDLYNSL